MSTHEKALHPELEHLKSWRRKMWSHPACEKCHKLYPKMSFYGFLWSDISMGCQGSMFTPVQVPLTTKCCGMLKIDWHFLVGTRKGKINLTVRSRVAAIQKRGVWAALSM